MRYRFNMPEHALVGKVRTLCRNMLQAAGLWRNESTASSESKDRQGIASMSAGWASGASPAPITGRVPGTDRIGAKKALVSSSAGNTGEGTA